jgi:hypothetical protein
MGKRGSVLASVAVSSVLLAFCFFGERERAAWRARSFLRHSTSMWPLNWHQLHMVEAEGEGDDERDEVGNVSDGDGVVDEG